jgi:hypothetical protein
MKRPTIPENTTCTYCGTFATTWDHVVCVSLIRPRNNSKPDRYQSGDWIVPACNDCNSFLSDRVLNAVPLRAAWLYKEYRRRFRKILTSPQWSDEEINELEGAFKIHVIESMLIQAELDHRLAHLRKIGAKNSDFMRPLLAGS